MARFFVWFFLSMSMMVLSSVNAEESEPSAPVPLASKGKWLRLTEDGMHDLSNPRLKMLQNPGDSLSLLPPDVDGTNRAMIVGNQVRWMRALEEGYINPRTSLDPNNDGKMKVLDLNVLLSKRNSGEVKRVLFPHRQHTMWLDCSNCHEWLFKSKAGANPITMFSILDGEFCGRCHGAVAFPLTQCQRCHRIPFDVQIPQTSTTEQVENAMKK